MSSVRLGRRYRFSASHRLHTPMLSDERNREVYGKCNNPYGHGHNFVLEVVIAGELNQPGGRLMPLQLLDTFIDAIVIKRFDNMDLNTQIEEFAGLPPTSENLARVLARRLTAAWPHWFGAIEPRLEKVRIWETPRNVFEETTGGERERAELAAMTPARAGTEA
jgi:6-pyruvoyltetrahydropterin/6-carboxytetrahydropterin synthase